MPHLLIVEDDLLNVEVISRVLTGRGHRVTAVRTAEEAIGTAGAGGFDAVLLDNVLPGMTGLEALSSLVTRTKAPIIVMSGDTDPEKRKDALLLGAKEFLPKPLDFDVLDALLRRL